MAVLLDRPWLIDDTVAQVQIVEARGLTDPQLRAEPSADLLDERLLFELRPIAAGQSSMSQSRSPSANNASRYASGSPEPTAVAR